jgi:hypothetical protein
MMIKKDKPRTGESQVEYRGNLARCAWKIVPGISIAVTKLPEKPRREPGNYLFLRNVSGDFPTSWRNTRLK